MSRAGTPPRPSRVLEGALLAGGVAAASMPVAGQLAFAGGVVTVLGLPHGASDLAVVSPERRGAFLAAYLLAVVAVLSLWIVTPLASLAGFLGLSAVHFAIDGREGEGRTGDWGIGALLVAGPALLHPAALGALFESVLHRPEAASALATVMQALAILALVPVLRALAAGERLAGGAPGPVAIGLAATLLLPPLVGFACGFVLLHARGQTIERQHALGCVSASAYLWRVAPVLLGAVAALGATVILLARAGLDDVALLFAGIAALAVPHMLVTPLWRRPAMVPARAA